MLKTAKKANAGQTDRPTDRQTNRPKDRQIQIPWTGQSGQTGKTPGQ